MEKCWCGNKNLIEYSKDYYKCTNCNTLVNKHFFDAEAIDNVKDEQRDLYGSHYWEEEMLKVTRKSSLSEIVDMYLGERVVYWLRYFLQYGKLGGNVVEIGCGLGQMQYALKELGYNQTAYELSPQICNYMRNTLGINVKCGEFHSSSEKYDSVLAFDLFEHIFSPRAFLEEIDKSLLDDGIICFQMPCYDNELNYEEMLTEKPRFAEQLKSDQHIFLYSRESIQRILSEYGYSHIVFEPACFGDDYDMFLFASKKELVKNSDKEIDDYLNAVGPGRIVKALIGAKAECQEKDKEISKLSKMMDNAIAINIGVNLASLYPGKIGGAEQYVRNTIDEMSSIDYLNVFVFVNDKAFSTFNNHDNITILMLDPLLDYDEQLLTLIDSQNIDVMFCPLFFVAPKNCPIPVVASILDIQHEFYPQYFEPKVLEDIRNNTRDTLSRVDGIITISEYSKQTIIDKYRIPANKIKVTYLNSDSVFYRTLEDSEKVRIKSEIADDYIFYPANSWPHKNHINLLKAYLILKKQYHIRHKLVLTGDAKQKSEEIQRFIEDNELKDDVVYLGYRKQEDMPYIFAGATVLVFPSLFEGFGIPLVEAMRVGTAIACSSCGSIPEVAGNAAMYFDAKKPEDIAEKVNNLLTNEDLRNDLIAKGKALAENYSWKKCAKDTVSYLRKVSNKMIPSAIQLQDWPLVTIVTPSYNQGEFIRETIESVLSQDYPRIEYIVVDGGSTDNTIEILKGYGDRIKWVSEKDKGQGDAVNKGIRMAKGDIIGWLNSDDTYLEGAISKAVDYFYHHPQTDMVYGEAYYTEKDGTIADRYPTMLFSKEKLAHNCFICQPAAFFTKSIAMDAGLIDIKYQCSMDYEFWMRIAKIGKISYIPDYLATSRLYEENKTLSRREEVFSECFEAVKKHYGYVPSSWCRGYADYKSEGKRNALFALTEINSFIKLNYDNWGYFKNNFKSILPERFRGKIRSYLTTERAQEDYVARYKDGWVSKKYIQEFASEENYNKLTVIGQKIWPLKSNLTIEVLIGGSFAGKISIVDNGPFKESIQLPREAKKATDSLIRVELRMNKTYVPAKCGGGNDFRKLSFILDDIVLENENETFSFNNNAIL